MLKHIRIIRIIIAAIVFALFIIGFASAGGGAAGAVHGLAHFQVVPSLLLATTGIALPLAVVLVITLLCGRIYCSCLCPTGIMQDCIARIDRLVRTKKKRYRAQPPRSIVRYSILGATLAAWILGFNAMLTLLDPYGIFGRIGAALVRPVGIACNNLIALICNAMDNYNFYNQDIPNTAAGTLVISAAMLLVLAALSYRRGRLYCNLICPVGTLLGLISKIALIKVKINDSRCNKCMLCVTKCKSGCIAAKAGKIDHSRCVVCGNCLGVCKKDAIRLVNSFSSSVKKQKVQDNFTKY